MDKLSIRKEIRRRRKSLNEEEFRQMSKKIYSSIFLPSFYLPDHIGIYVSYSHEVDTINIIKTLLEMNKHVYVPKVVGNRDMYFVEIHSMDELVPGYKGILEPISKQKVENKIIELMFTPLVAFNEKLERIGWGGGYYDTFFSTCQCRKVGLAFEFQQFSFESEPFDIPLDVIITEKRLYNLSNFENEL